MSKSPNRRYRWSRPRHRACPWSLVHGFTMLLLDGGCPVFLRRLPKGTNAEILLDAMLKSTVGGRRDVIDALFFV